jgi:hypothetical protein
MRASVLACLRASVRGGVLAWKRDFVLRASVLPFRSARVLSCRLACVQACIRIVVLPCLHEGLLACILLASLIEDVFEWRNGCL